ncbi:unnamed protein product [Musa acuminata subsp. malaccensis]|uniref:(wild Malaysian banana) hypothetical protein n=1 Tax=Musa acuminata subsp. malaccensis TaxID=214687 RepID=A0A804HZM5_MUSAM|nr:unnamed protein product [Musa acuminata subsp. malaccensis]
MNTCLDARTVSVLLHHSGFKLVFVDVISRPLLDGTLRLFPDSLEPLRVILIEDLDEAPPAQNSTLTCEKLIETGAPEFRWVRPLTEWDPVFLNHAPEPRPLHCHRGLFSTPSAPSSIGPSRSGPSTCGPLLVFHSDGWSIAVASNFDLFLILDDLYLLIAVLPPI